MKLLRRSIGIREAMSGVARAQISSRLWRQAVVVTMSFDGVVFFFRGRIFKPCIFCHRELQGGEIWPGRAARGRGGVEPRPPAGHMPA